MIEPGKIAAGDSLNWTRNLADYPAGAGYTLHYTLFNAAAAYTIDTTADGDNHAVSLGSADTKDWAVGRYDWTAYVTGPNDFRKSLFVGVMLITQDLTTGAYDGRSHAVKMVEAIEAALEGRATNNQLDLVKSQFGDRASEHNSAALIAARDKYRAEIQAEEQAAALARGENLPNKIKARFVR